MINKRLLIKNILAHYDENSFYDKKRQLNLHSIEGKGKFLKHVCALSNSNFINNSYIIVGVEDDTNEIIGVDFFDDSKIQNLVNAYLFNPPSIQYENVPFPNLPKEKVIGLVTIKSKSKPAYFKRPIYTILQNQYFIRIGSNSKPTEERIPFTKSNFLTVSDLEKNAHNTISHTLSSVLDFLNQKHPDIECNYAVFKDLFVVCWAGIPKIIEHKTFFSRVDIEMITEQLKLFYSTKDEVTIEIDETSFTIIEYIVLGFQNDFKHYPLEKTIITFFDNGYYKINTEILFKPPLYNKKFLHHVYNHQLHLLKKLTNNIKFNPQEVKELVQLPDKLLLCYLNKFEDAISILIAAKQAIKNYKDPQLFITFKVVMRIVRKLKYN